MSAFLHSCLWFPSKTAKQARGPAYLCTLWRPIFQTFVRSLARRPKALWFRLLSPCGTWLLISVFFLWQRLFITVIVHHSFLVWAECFAAMVYEIWLNVSAAPHYELFIRRFLRKPRVIGPGCVQCHLHSWSQTVSEMGTAVSFFPFHHSSSLATLLTVWGLGGWTEEVVAVAWPCTPSCTQGQK